MHTTIRIIKYYVPFQWWLMKTAKCNSFSFLQLCNKYMGIIHTYKAIWMHDISGHALRNVRWRWRRSWYFVAVVIMTEYIVGHVSKAITYHHLRSYSYKTYTCSTIQGCATIKINHENKVICIQICSIALRYYSKVCHKSCK